MRSLGELWVACMARSSVSVLDIFFGISVGKHGKVLTPCLSPFESKGFRSTVEWFDSTVNSEARMLQPKASIIHRCVEYRFRS